MEKADRILGLVYYVLGLLLLVASIVLKVKGFTIDAAYIFVLSLLCILIADSSMQNADLIQIKAMLKKR